MTKKSPLGIGSPIPRMTAARYSKNDEFYTRMPDIEKELGHYVDAFRGRTVYLNCDDPSRSQFWHFFRNSFDRLGLERLIATYLERDGIATKSEIVRGSNGVAVSRLIGNGDFRSPECLGILDESDIVVTNPPFSLFGEFVTEIADRNKDFIVIGNLNSLTSRRVWKLIVSGRAHVGATAFNQSLCFRVPDDFAYSDRYRSERKIGGDPVARVGGITWVTTLEHDQRQSLHMTRRYADDPSMYPHFDNYSAIEVSKVSDIPHDYDGLMGVPVTFLNKHDPKQFSLIGTSDNGFVPSEYKVPHRFKHSEPYLDGSRVYKRIFIMRVHPRE